MVLKHHPHSGTRSFAEQSLAKLGASKQQLMDVYVAALSAKAAGVRLEAVNKLAKLGDIRAVEGLLETLTVETNKDVRSSIAVALGHLGDRRAIEPLVGMLKEHLGHWNGGFRLSAEKALVELGASEEQIINGYIAALSSKDGEVRLNAVTKIGRDRRAVEPFLQMLKNEDWRYDQYDIRSKVRYYLGQLGVSE